MPTDPTGPTKMPSTDLADVMTQLENYGTAQNRKIYVRHGAASGNVFGVSFANLNILLKKIRCDHSLATQLWETGNYDARNLATKIADPSKMNITVANRWVSSANNYLHSSLLGGMLARSPVAKSLMQKWCASKKEFTKQSGYALLSACLRDNVDAISAGTGRDYLRLIELEIHHSPNWARYSMNWSLIAIGTYIDALADEAVETAGRIGKVEVDHGETSCKTPDAAAYIVKARDHPKRKRTRR